MAKEIENQKQEEQPQARPCPKDCKRCGLQQQVYCAAQMSFYLVEKVSALQIQIEEQNKNMMIINEQLNSMKSEQQAGELINPIQEIAQ